MSNRGIRQILEDVEAGRLSSTDALLKLKLEPFEDISYAKVDGHRTVRQGISEVIYGAGKTPEQIIGIAGVMVAGGQEPVIITRIGAETAAEIGKAFPLRYHARSRLGIIGDMPEPDGRGTIVVATGGTTDIPVAEEAALTAEALGNTVNRMYDVGVSGIHRLLAHREEIMSAQAIVAIAGMEGALASVIGGLADCPVIAVPTSVGYGAAFGGVAALLSMLNSCAAGVSVVNIDNGFGAGCLASMINHIGV
jgi:NCAIR mutase (PurE)-related protein